MLKVSWKLTVYPNGTICFASRIFRHTFIRSKVILRNIGNGQPHVNFVRWRAYARFLPGRTKNLTNDMLL